MHPRTAAAFVGRLFETAAQLHLLEGIRDGQLLEHHLLPDGRPQWDTIDTIPLSHGEQILADIAWELGGNRPSHAGVVCRAVAHLDHAAYGRVVEALAIRRGWTVDLEPAWQMLTHGRSA